jgi:hypothetical protein
MQLFIFIYFDLSEKKKKSTDIINIFSSETAKNQKPLFLDLYENGVFPHFSIGMDVAKNERGKLLN